MNALSHTMLPGRAVLKITGPDAQNFLQGIITNDIRRVTPERAVYAALLSPQGKFLHDFFIGQQADALLLDCEAGRRDDLIKRFSMYKLRSKVTIEDVSGSMEISAAYGENAAYALELEEEEPGRTVAHNRGICFVDPRHARLGVRCITEKAHDRLFPGFAESSPEHYDRLRLEVGIPDGSRDFIVDRSFALELGMDALHGVDFAKGCYVGQEVTARSKHRGTLRKALYQVHAKKGNLPTPDTPVLAGKKEIGILRSHIENIGLAILRREEVEQAEKDGTPLTADGVILTVRLPEWYI